MFLILTGSSGVGKNTVITKLLNDNKDLYFMPTFTTREKREGEIEGNPYHFISKNDFQKKIKNKEFIEYELIHNNFYGSCYSVLNESLAEKKTLIKDFGIEGAQNFSQKISDITPAVKIFLTTTKRELIKRLKGRGEKQIKLRMKRYKREQGEINKFDFVIYNDDLSRTCEYIEFLKTFKIENILPTKNVKKLSTKKVNFYISELQKGKTLKPIKIKLENKKVYIIKGHEKFIASLLTNKPVAKMIDNYKKIKITDKENEKEWKELIKQSK